MAVPSEPLTNRNAELKQRAAPIKEKRRSLDETCKEHDEIKGAISMDKVSPFSRVFRVFIIIEQFLFVLVIHTSIVFLCN